MTKNRVVVTGLGALTPIGNTVPEFWDGLVAGKTGAGLITRFDTEAFDVKFACEIKGFNAEDHFEKKEVRKMDSFVRYAVVAAREAVADAGLKIDESNSDRIGVVIGVGMGGVTTIEEQMAVLLTKGPNRVTPFLVPKMIPNMAAGLVSIYLGARGPNTCITTACASSTNAVGEAYRMIQRGDATAMICGGAEATITPLSIAGFSNIQALSKRNDEYLSASRPFDGTRDGFVMGEGAGILILESLESAMARGARIYAELAGYGLSGDAFHMTAPGPNGEGGARAMKMAVDSTGMALTDVDYINAHGTSTPLNDKLETQGIKALFGDHARKLMISSNKSMIGHLIGAAGGVEAVATVKTVSEGIVPPTINYQTPDPECDLDYVPNTARKAEVNLALSNSLGFGGHNATIAVRKFEK
ncbi:beta-ketoacyl-[acyl-carrier-protein] synthase II [candidate division BRC1 bacterium HGW-BRC1-1]|jgi:3-oxoacyl-[acyl-carrier-protein] synthase II|nr:MAG: beta-ketoacyl-[acyl-carrier-protein] synthase II [candidate division BRC1 bacterium HGW-BRC1-1]